ncbi:MAG TPA: insulinase family protein [Oscillospiraceae bacterium]|nr:insulinase family protein [Oscillospiraceae bacterium]
MSNISRTEIAKGVHFCSFSDARYFTNRISVNFITTLAEKTASPNALVPNLLKQSSTSLPSFTLLNKKLSELYGASLAGYVRRIGDSQSICLAIESIDNSFALDNEDIAAELCNILADCLFSPVLENGKFPADVFKLEKQNLIDDIEAEINEKRSYAVHRTEAITCAGEPYGVGRLGSKQSAEAMTNDDVYSAYTDMLSTAKVEIICVGKGQFDTIQSILANRFSKLDRGEVKHFGSKLSPAHSTVIKETEKIEVNQSKLVMSFKSDNTDTTANTLMVNLYGGTANSKLFLNVRERLSLCYYCAARFDPEKGLMLVDCGVENENISKAHDEILAQLTAVQNGEVSEREIDEARLDFITSLRGIGDKPSQVENWYLQRIYRGENITPEELVEKLQTVTAAQIVACAKAMKLDTVFVLTGANTAKEGE